MERWQRARLPAATAAAAAALVLAPVALRRLQDALFPPGKPLQRQPKLRRKLRVAVLGAGVGGTALARWLRDLYGEDLELTVVNDGPVGGRVQAVEAADGRCYEGGAAIISELNEYMIGFMRRLKLKELKRIDTPLGIFDGQALRVQEADPLAAPLGLRRLAALRSAWRLACRYGLTGLRRLQGLMRHPSAPRFPRLYRALARGEAYDTAESLLGALGPECVRLTREAAAAWLVARPPTGGGLPENVVGELVTGGMRANYGGQTCSELHALVGLVSIAGGFASRCFAVKGGNQQVPRGLLASAQADRQLLGATARLVRRVDSGGGRAWEVLVEPTVSGEAMKGPGTPGPTGELRNEGPFDLVAVAHPLERSCLKFEGLPKALPAQGNFRRCVTHFVQGSLRRGVFDSASACRSPPMLVLTVAESAAPFYSIGLQLPVDHDETREAQQILDAALRGEPAVFKVFAPNALTEAELDGIFEQRQGQGKVLDWYAYPEYSVPQALAPFLLDGEEDGSLLYLNAIEQAASAMEMSALAARNAANLARRFVERRRGAEGGF